MKISECTIGRIVTVTAEYEDIYPNKYERVGVIKRLTNLHGKVDRDQAAFSIYEQSCEIENIRIEVEWTSGNTFEINPKFLKIFED